MLLPFLLVCREKREAEELAKHRAERPKIQQQFSDLKRGLSSVTDEEWENLPEVGNLTRKKRKRDERSFVVPDSVLVGDRAKTEYESALDPMQQEVRIVHFHGHFFIDDTLPGGWSRYSRRIGYSYQFRGDWSGSRQDSLAQARPNLWHVECGWDGYVN